MLYHCRLYAVPRTCNHNIQWIRDTNDICRRAPAHSQVGFEVMWAGPHPDILVERACGNPGSHNH